MYTILPLYGFKNKYVEVDKQTLHTILKQANIKIPPMVASEDAANNDYMKDLHSFQSEFDFKKIKSPKGYVVSANAKWFASFTYDVTLLYQRY